MTRRERRSPHARLGLAPQASAEEAKRAREQLVSFLEGAPEGLRGWAQDEIAAAEDAYAALSAPAGARAAGGSPLRRLAVGIATLGATAGIVVGVYSLGGGQGEAGPKDAGPAATRGLSPGDQLRVSQLTTRLDANPEDAAALVQLGDVYFKSGDYERAGGWMEQAVALEPGNVKARLALGAARFNLGDAGGAQRQWLRVVAIDPGNVEAYYDLGFLYLSENPPDMGKAKRMWRKVVAMAPDSAVAKTVATHLDSMKKSGSPGATPPPGPG